jgi:hypothetical protein
MKLAHIKAIFLARPETLGTLPTCLLVALSILLGSSIGALTEGPDQTNPLAPYFTHTFIWLFGIILFTDLGGSYISDSKGPFWLAYLGPAYYFTGCIAVAFLFTAFCYSALTCTLCYLVGVFNGQAAHLAVLLQACWLQTLGLWLVASMSFGIGHVVSSGLRQILVLSISLFFFFLSSIIPLFFAQNPAPITFILEALPRLDLFDNRNSLYMAQASLPAWYTIKTSIYALASSSGYLILAYISLRRKGWK